MRRHRTLAHALLALVLVAATPALAQDEAKPPAVRPAAAAAAAETPPETLPETTDRWVAFTKAYTERLEATGRSMEVLQECVAWVELDSRDLKPVVTGSVKALEQGTAPGMTLKKGGGFYAVAERLLHYGVARGASGDSETGEGANPTLAYVIGRLRFSDQEWLVAYRMFKAAYEGGFDRDTVREWYFRATVNRGVVYVDERGAAEAIRSMREVMKEHADAPGVTPRDIAYAKLMLAAAHRLQDERPEAERLLREVVDANQADSKVHTLLGRIYVDQGRVQEGLDQYRRAMQLSSDPSYVEPLLDTASALLKTSPPRPEEALQVVQSYLRVRRDHIPGLFVLAQVQEARGDLRTARNLYRRVLRMQPGSRETLFKLVQVLSMTGNSGDAEEAEEVRKRLNALDDERERRDKAMMEGGNHEPPPADTADTDDADE